MLAKELLRQSGGEGFHKVSSITGPQSDTCLGKTVKDFFLPHNQMQSGKCFQSITFVQ